MSAHALLAAALPIELRVLQDGTKPSGPGRIRTDNPLLAKQLLYHWSYKPILLSLQQSSLVWAAFPRTHIFTAPGRQKTLNPGVLAKVNAPPPGYQLFRHSSCTHQG